jgi:hypothetical protein
VEDQLFQSLFANLEGLLVIFDLLASHIYEVIDISQILSIVVSVPLHDEFSGNSTVVLYIRDLRTLQPIEVFIHLLKEVGEFH